VHPILFHVGSFPIHAFGVMTALAFALGLWTATRRARRVGLSGDVIADVTLWIMIGTLIGARAVYVITYWQEEFSGQPLREIFAIWHGGLVYYGGLIGATVAGAVYLRWKKLPLLKIADVLAPSIALGSVFGRIGCLLNGCCYGRASDLPWAVCFPEDNPLHPPTTPVHPTEIYDSLLNLGLYALLAWGFRRKKFDGQIFAAYLVCYAFTRSFVEYFRGDYSDAHHHFGLTPAQLVSVPILIAGLTLTVVLSRRSPAK